MIASIDPGIHESGIACWDSISGHLFHAFSLPIPGSLRGPRAWKTMAWTVKEALPALDALVIEIPQVYETRARSKGDPNDLIQLAACVGAIVGQLPTGVEVSCVKPAEWKGQVKKEVTQARCLTILTEEEKQRIKLPSAKSLAHNVWDALGLGLWHLDRLGIRTKRIPAFS